MATSTVEAERVRVRREGSAPQRADFVLYWMQQAQRAEHNPALEYAIQRANEAGLPLMVVFCVVADHPHASQRHYTFMFEGLRDVARRLGQRGIGFEVLLGAPADTLGALAHRTGLLVMDRSHLPLGERWRRSVMEVVDGPVHEVDADVVVPIDLASDKLETAARTFRPKVHEHLDRFVVELVTTPVDHPSAGEGSTSISLARTAGTASLDVSDVDDARAHLDVPDHPGAAPGWEGGTLAAKRRLDAFCTEVLPDYEALRNRYDLEESSSKLSPYLHYGQISPVEIVRRVRAEDAPEADRRAFVEELVVRRELAVNLVLHADTHDTFAVLPDWAQQTLKTHASDERVAVLTAAELEAAETPDDIWNAIMREIRRTGWVHNQLRMYWGKQIVRWTNTPQHAFRTLLDLNNRYFLDGRDANSYTNVAWCFGRHDQGFQERDVIGKVRPFTDQALRRKGDLDAWLDAERERPWPAA